MILLIVAEVVNHSKKDPIFEYWNGWKISTNSFQINKILLIITENKYTICNNKSRKNNTARCIKMRRKNNENKSSIFLLVIQLMSFFTTCIVDGHVSFTHELVCILQVHNIQLTKIPSYFKQNLLLVPNSLIFFNIPKHNVKRKWKSAISAKKYYLQRKITSRR